MGIGEKCLHRKGMIVLAKPVRACMRDRGQRASAGLIVGLVSMWVLSLLFAGLCNAEHAWHNPLSPRR